jgi:hypothetical protein
LVLPEPLLAVEPVSLLDELPLGGVLEEALPEPLVEGWSLPELLLELDGEDGELLLLPLLSLLFIARLPEEPDGELGDDEDEEAEPEPESGLERATEPGVELDPDELPDCERRESLPRSQADSPKVAASAAAMAVRKNLLCSMSTISSVGIIGDAPDRIRQRSTCNACASFAGGGKRRPTSPCDTVAPEKFSNRRVAFTDRPGVLASAPRRPSPRHDRSRS